MNYQFEKFIDEPINSLTIEANKRKHKADDSAFGDTANSSEVPYFVWKKFLVIKPKSLGNF